MNAITLLKAQHGEIDKLFLLIDYAETSAGKRRLVEELADQLASHAATEEHHFYPAVRARRIDDIPLEALDDQRRIKRALAELLETGVRDETFGAKVAALKEQVERHVYEEENDLFPRLKQIVEPGILDAVGKRMRVEYVRLASGHPWHAILSETDKPAPL